MTTDFRKDWKCGKLLGRSNRPYPILIDDFHGDRAEFIRGLRLAGCGIKVEFKHDPVSS